jgi:hypothetical protein
MLCSGVASTAGRLDGRPGGRPGPLLVDLPLAQAGAATCEEENPVAIVEVEKMSFPFPFPKARGDMPA